MRVMVLIAMSLFALPLFAGSLFSYDKNQVLVTALQAVKLRHSDLATLELSPYPVSPKLDRAGNLYAIMHFSYKKKGTDETLFVCVSLDENGKVLTLVRDIESVAGLFKDNWRPKNFDCYEPQKNKGAVKNSDARGV